MKKILLIVIPLFLFACKKESSRDGIDTNNKPPVANAGSDISLLLPLDSARLDGTASTDPDGIITEWSWTKISGPTSFTFFDAAIAKPVARNLNAGIYQFELKVTDNGGLSAKDTVQVIVSNPTQPNQPPVAFAGSDQTITLPTNTMTLNGSSSSDPDNNITNYSWTKISGPPLFNIINSNAVQTQVTNLSAGSYQFELKVTDAGGLIDKDTIMVTVTQPTATCGTMYPLSSSCSGHFVCVNNVAGVQYTGHSDFFQAYGASASTQSKVYFAGGHDDFSVYGGSLSGGIEYDPVNHSSRCFTLSVPRSFLAGATAGDKILFAGGSNVSGYTNPNPVYPTVDIYDGQTLAHTVASLSEARSHLASVSIGTHAYFIGGKTQSDFSGKMDIYNSITNSWQAINLPSERGYAGATVIGNNIYIAGGKNNLGNLRTIDIYNVQSGQWSSIVAPNEHPIASVAAINNKLIVAGGDGLNNSSADIYNTTTGQWTSVNLSSPRFNMTVASANNKIVFLGGANSFSGIAFTNESQAIDIYNDITGGWSVATISPGVSGVMAASLGTRIFYIGFMWANGTTIANLMMIITP